MKAKEYAELFIKAEKQDNKICKETSDISRCFDEQLEICKKFIYECSDIAEKRNIKSVDRIRGVFREQNEKWFAFCNILNKHFGYKSMRYDGFKSLITKISPNLLKYF